MTDVLDSTTTGEPATERTVAFISDPRATDLFLEETVSKVVESLDIQRGIVDLSSVAGLAIAQVLQDAGIPFEALDYGQEVDFKAAAPVVHGSWAAELEGITLATLEQKSDALRSNAERVIEVPIGELGSIDANVVLIPAMVGTDEKLIDFSMETISGVAIAQLEEKSREFVMVLPPERGLRGLDDGSFERLVLHVTETGESA